MYQSAVLSITIIDSYSCTVGVRVACTCTVYCVHSDEETTVYRLYRVQHMLVIRYCM